MFDTEESEIAFSDDIVKQVAKEFNLPEKKIARIYYIMVDYLHYLARETSALTIYLPFLGKLHIKRSYIKERLKNLLKINSPTRSLEDKRRIFQKKEKALDAYIDEIKKSKHSNKTIRHLERNVIDRPSYNFGYKKKDIIELQNRENE